MRYFLDPEGHIQKIPKGSKFYKESCPHIRSLFWLQIRCSKPATFVRGPCAVCKILRFETLRSQLSQEWKNYDEGVAIILKFAICWDGAKFWNRNQISHKNWLEIFADFKISSPAIGWNFIKFYFETSIFSLLWLIRGWALSWSWAQCALRTYLLMGSHISHREKLRVWPKSSLGRSYHLSVGSLHLICSAGDLARTSRVASFDSNTKWRTPKILIEPDEMCRNLSSWALESLFAS